MKYPMILFLFFVFQVSAAQQSQQKLNFNKNWQYLEKPLSKLQQVQQAYGWQTINLPHTWNSQDVMDMAPGYRRHASWYKKEYDIEQLSSDSDYLLYFEGSNITTHVYVNEILAGKHVGGYVGFEIDITDYLQEGNNTILVKVDNSYNPDVIPSQKSDFFIYGGIIRDVWLKVLPKTRITQAKISTPKVSEKNALTSLDVSVANPKEEKLTVNVILFDPQNQATFQKRYKWKETEKLKAEFEVPTPQLWDVDEPNLYILRLELQKKGEVIYHMEEKIGYRWYEFKEHGPFYLNGRRLLLRGTHRHEEHAGYGAALPDSLHRADMKAVKEMGANFIRLGHYPQDPEVYRACDELGLLVWDELPWCRGGIGKETWKSNTKRLLKEMILQNYNHPSIILWSLGNEIYWLPDFEGGGDTTKLNSFLKELNEIAHDLDPYRKTAMRKYYEGAHIVDVFSPSIWSGWYSGSYKNYEETINKAIEKYPRFLHMEYGGSSHVGRHTENPITGEGFQDPGAWEEPINQVEAINVARHGDWSENYIVDLFDWYLSVTETHPTLTGNAQWIFKDFGTPLRPENAIPYVNQKGLMDREGNPKDAYYVFKSYWAKEPFVYIESKTWTVRNGPEGLARNVCVFSNMEEVSLKLNGQDLGTKTKDLTKYPATGLNWDVPFEEGRNELVATGYSDGNPVRFDTLQVKYWFSPNGKPEELTLSFEKLENGNYLVTTTAVDKNGRRCIDYQDRVYFQCLGGGIALKNLGTPTGSDVIELADGQASIQVIPHKDVDKVVMMVLNQSFKGTFLEIELK
jgi:beta-galactosidase